MALLKYGRDHNLCKKRGWLKDLLVSEGMINVNVFEDYNRFTYVDVLQLGIMDAGKDCRKQRVYQDFKNQEAFREGMQAVCGEQPAFDPRLFDDRDKNDKFKPQSKNKVFVPKTILTIQYLIWAYDVSYPTFKRLHKEGFVVKKYVPPHAGKCVLTDGDYAKQIYTGRRMYVTSAMDTWKEKQRKTYGKIELSVKREYCAKKKLEWQMMSDGGRERAIRKDCT